MAGSRRLRGDSFLGLGLLMLEAVPEIGCALRMGGGAEDCALDFLQDLQPALDIGGVILPRLGGQGQIGTQKRRAQLGDQFLAGVAFIAPALAAKVAVKPALVFRPVGQLMGKGGIVGLRAAERLKGRHLHMIAAAAIMGRVSDARICGLR